MIVLPFVRGLDASEMDVETVVDEYSNLLKTIARRKFRVPPDEAEALAQDVFVSYMQRRDEIRDVRAWLVGAICHASRHYWRLMGRTTEIDSEAALDRVDPASERILDSLPDQLSAREVLERIGPRAREVLRMRYVEGASTAEIAKHFNIKPDSGKKLIQRSLRRAREVYATEAPLRIGRTGVLRDALSDFVNAFQELV